MGTHCNLYGGCQPEQGMNAHIFTHVRNTPPPMHQLALRWLNTTTVEHQDRWDAAVYNRPPGQGLLTVANHTSTLDDPMVISSIVPLSFFASEHRHHGMRWSLCAREICHTNVLFRYRWPFYISTNHKQYSCSQFFRSGKTLPIDRGAGLQQPIMQTAGALLRRGDWVHVFPEGRVHYTGRLGPLRWGVGKLLCDSVAGGHPPPIVLPWYHSGMGDIMPKGARIPRVGHAVSVVVGEPLNLDDVICKCGDQRHNQEAVWRELTERIGKALRALEQESPPNTSQVTH